MARHLVLVPEAQEDVREAYGWYEEQHRGLGDELLECLDEAFSRIATHPARYPRASIISGGF